MRSLRNIGRGLDGTRRPSALLIALAGAAVAVLSGVGCDNPACVFGPGNCQGGSGGGVLGAQAFPPASGTWIEDGAPAVSEIYPSGTSASSTTPVAILFSESLAPSTALTAFRLERFDDFGSIPIVATPSLVGDGRLLVLAPATALAASTTYRVIYSSNGNARDYTGQSLGTAPGSVLASFTTTATDPAAPRVVASYPEDGAQNQSAKGEIVVLFDRPMAAPGFIANGWAVTAGGVAPAFDPAPSPLAAPGGFGPPDTRVWRWRSLDGSAEPVSVGSGVDVALSLSPAGAKLIGTTGGELPATVIAFETAPFSTPTGARLLSQPADGIGINNLTPGSSDPLQLEVDLEGAQGGDRLTVFVFGENFANPPVLVAVQRTLTLAGGVGDTVAVDVADLNLTSSTSPLKARFADGELVFALRLARGAVVSPIALLDVDADAPGVQGPILDTVRPTLIDLVAPGGGGDLYRSDLAGVVLMGTASEPLRQVIVETDLGGNGPDVEVAGSDDDGFFIARPVPIGVVEIVDQPLAYEFVLQDRALNESAPIPGFFRQLGAASGGPLVPADTLAIEVFDAQSLAPIVGAFVVTHADLGDGSGYPSLGSATTDVDGRAPVPTHAAPAVGTIVTVDASGYGRFTFHGVRSARLSIPLARTPAPVASVVGTASTTSAFGALVLPSSDLAVDDTRRGENTSPSSPAAACVGSPFGGQGVTCPFGPIVIRPARPGARAFLAGDFGLLEGNFSAASLIKAFEFAPARAPVAAGGVQTDDIAVGRLLNEANVPAEELPVAFAPTQLSALFATGVDVADLVDDPQFGARPRIVFESALPGQLTPLTLGLGIAYPSGATSWTARAAYPGAVAEYLADLADPAATLRLAAELRDGAGALSRISFTPAQLAGLGGTLFAPPVPVAIAPAEGATALAPFDVVVPNTLLDGVFAGTADGGGLYRAELIDGAGRGWTIVRPDVADGVSAEVRLHVPDLLAAGGAALPVGALVLRTASLAHAGFDAESFLFSDLERLAGFRTRSAPRTLDVR